MKLSIFPLLAILFLCVSCGQETISTDQKSLEEYIEENNLAVQEGPEGLKYIIEEPGTADKPSADAMVTVHYIGRLTNNDVFDQTQEDPRTFDLNNLIRGWQLGIPLVGAGGKVRLFLPPNLGYGSRSAGSVPANSNLIFDIELVSFEE
ncbi:MAG: FKBP-type peptidyl-prolyl cis-trans isomerase [Bacteroidota bacterium]